MNYPYTQKKTNASNVHDQWNHVEQEKTIRLITESEYLAHN